MGSQLTKNYDVDKDVNCLGGTNNIWRVHNAIKKGTAKQRVSVFIFDKKKSNQKV